MKTNKKTLLIIIVMIIIIAGASVAIFGWPRAKISQSPDATAELKLADDAYPLYSGAVWGKPSVGTVTLGTSTVSAVEADSVPVMKTMSPADVFLPFENYYAAKLISAGWVVDNSLAADGPGSGITAYRKSGQVMEINYQSQFLNVSDNAPEQCPCNVSLSIVSAK